MTVLRNAAVAATAFLCLPSVAIAGDDAPLSMSVSTRGVRLDSAAGLAELTRRVHVEARAVCGTGSLDLASQIEARACRADMERAGAARVAELAVRHGVELAGN